MEKKKYIAGIVLFMTLLLAGCGKENVAETNSGTEVSITTDAKALETETETSNEVSKEEFDRLAAENKELLNQAMTLMYEQHQTLANEDLLPSFESGKFYTDTTIRHQEMTAAAMMMQNVIDGTSDYSSLLSEVQDVNMLEGIEIADFEEVSKEDLEEAINEVRAQNEALSELISKMSPNSK